MVTRTNNVVMTGQGHAAIMATNAAMGVAAIHRSASRARTAVASPVATRDKIAAIALAVIRPGQAILFQQAFLLVQAAVV